MPGIASLFSGVGAVEHGLRLHLPDVPLLLTCDINPRARLVLAARFPGVPCHDDVTTLAALPEGTTVVSAGAPCTDLSPMGHMAGITGAASGLVSHVFRLVEGCATVQAVVIENVRNLLLLHEGAGIAYVTSELERLGFEWAYRVLDSFAFGLPQTRRRVVLVATRAPRAAAALAPRGRAAAAGAARATRRARRPRRL